MEHRLSLLDSSRFLQLIQHKQIKPKVANTAQRERE